ncbi:MAG: hypothetical protein K2I42_01155, partial [Anaeroplasmataceae bacterium]|nr:hypothetical protein [Anaeroplasmataceae bacterium]
MIEFLISWGPTFLFLFIVFNGFIWGLIRGFRKTTILFIHMLVIGIICLIFFLTFLNGKNFDTQITSIANSTLHIFGKDLVEVLDIDEATLASGKAILGIEGNPTLKEMLAIFLASQSSSDTITYYLILEDAPYIFAIVEMIVRILVAFGIFIIYFLLIFLFYLIYLIFYPVRRKVKACEKEFQKGERSTPYKKRRLLGGCVGIVRSLVMGVICFSFFGALLFVITGNQEMKNRYEIKKDGIEITFN